MTDTDITKTVNLARTKRHIDDMESKISRCLNDLPLEFQICLELPSDSDVVYYYMVNHDRDHRCIFWIDDLDFRKYVDEDFGMHSLSH